MGRWYLMLAFAWLSMCAAAAGLTYCPVKTVDILQQHRPVIAVKTNVLYDLATCINASAEVFLPRGFSVEATYMNPWWHSMSRHRTLQLRYLALTPRYYFGRSRQPYTSFFVGLTGGYAKYDLQWTRRGTQGTLWHISPLAGYSHAIARNWKMEYALSVGCLLTEYHRYTQVADTPKGEMKVHDYPWVSHLFRSVLPTGLSVSLVYTFCKKKRKEILS